MNKKEVAKKMKEGAALKKRENEANPEMHAFKNSLRRRGMSDSKIFHHALEQGERYRKEHPEHND